MSRVPPARYYIRPHRDRFALCDKQLHDVAVFIGNWEECAKRRLRMALEHREQQAGITSAPAEAVEMVRKTLQSV